MTPPAVAELELTDRVTSQPIKLQEVTDVLRGLNGSRKIVLSGIQEVLGDGTCTWHISSTGDTTTAQQIVKGPLTICKGCSHYSLSDYDCPHYRSEALYTLKRGVNDHIKQHPEDRVIPLVMLIQERLPESYNIQ